MSEGSTTSQNGLPSVLPTKRPLEDDHTPSVSSPLNPDASANRAKSSKPAVREQREKKDSLKKRESTTGIVRANTPDSKSTLKDGVQLQGSPSPIRYNHALPKEMLYYTGPRDPIFTSHEPDPLFTPDGRIELRRPTDHAENKKAYRYTHCIADPNFPHSRFYRQTDGPPFSARMSFEDSDKWFHFDDSATRVSNEKGWRMSRANVCAREGRFYYEVKILTGVPSEGPPVAANQVNPQPHIRMGWARREAPLDSPVGFDGYSYGITDIRFEPMHKSRASKFLDNGVEKPLLKKPVKGKQTTSTEFSFDEHAREGDVIGLEITLPSLVFHRKIADSSYNPAVDLDSGLDTGPSAPSTNDDTSQPDIVRDRFPVPYKGTVYFESIEYQRSKGMDAYGDRGPFTKEKPSPNHDDPTLRSLPHSSIKVYKNGKMVGTAFRNLMAFLPPASTPVGPGARQGFDDGMLGYFPAVGAFTGGVAEVNFGPDFWCPPEEMVAQDADMGGTGTEGARASTKLRGIGERYKEQIAEDVLFDVIDEADFFVQDGGLMEDPSRVAADPA